MTNAETGGADEAVHLVTIDWTRGKWAQSKGKYSREHLWHLGGGEAEGIRLSRLVAEGVSRPGSRQPGELCAGLTPGATSCHWIYANP
jgi:hypothetical protein